MRLVSTHGEGLTPEEWDDFVASQPTSTFCHLHGWSSVIRESLGQECLNLGARDEQGRLIAVLPLAWVRSALFGKYLVSMPFLSYGGPIGEEDGMRFLCEEAAVRAERSRVGLLELRNRVEIDAPGLTVNVRKVTVLLDLPTEPETLWKSVLSSKVRSQVRRPQKEGMTTRFGADQLGAFYRVFARNMRDLGTPVLARRFFERILAHLPERVEFGVVYLQDEPVAAGCGFTWRDEFEITWASSLREHNRMAPNMLLYWSFMERMIQGGVRTFNFGRCTPEGGTHRFKRQWGDTRDVPLPWAQWSPSGLDATPNPDGGAFFRLATRAWSRLPLALANRLGPAISRGLP